ncbi:MAG: DUF1926 domain-containing protein [Calditrichaeota bacterium]|nr:DUF1926 domain-containing protein [Calditrichota bacterium]
MTKIYFALGIHNHQPVGNFDHVFEEAYERAYRPFLEIMARHPGVKFSLHTSGCLFEWLEKHKPGYFELVGKLVERGQVELLGGAFYEPILCILPEEDALAQIEIMRDYLKKRFGAEVRGAWLAERVWEPHLASILAKSGIKYLPLDDYHFLSGGLRLEELAGYYLTESQSAPVGLFPIHQRLRYTIPFKEPQETLDYFREFTDSATQPMLCMADDGEKFGLWPKTYEWVYEKGWLERFCTALEESGDWVEVMSLGEAFDRVRPLGRTYLPTCSYFEMGEWVLPAKAGMEFENYVHEFEKRDDFESLRPFLKGGFWRYFLAKYDEANLLHKKMLHVSGKFARLSPKKKTEEQRRSLLRGQCNCPYWHGIFGGLYLPHLRHAVWRELLTAERLIDKAAHKTATWVRISQSDFDSDGNDEILMESSSLNAYLAPARGGMLFELDARERSYPFLNTLTRRVETYHARLAQASSQPSEGASIHEQVLSKEANIAEHLHLDFYPRRALLDHFLPWELSVEDFRDARFNDLGSFLQARYEVQETGRDFVTLTCRGRVMDNEVELTKRIRLVAPKKALQLSYRVANLSDLPLKIPFGIEWNLAFLSGNSPHHHVSIPGTDVQKRPLAEVARHPRVREMTLADEDEQATISFAFKEPTEIWRCPIESVSISEGGFERVFQSVALLFRWELSIEAQNEWEKSFECRLTGLQPGA